MIREYAFETTIEIEPDDLPRSDYPALYAGLDPRWEALAGGIRLRCSGVIDPHGGGLHRESEEAHEIEIEWADMWLLDEDGEEGPADPEDRVDAATYRGSALQALLEGRRDEELKERR